MNPGTLVLIAIAIVVIFYVLSGIKIVSQSEVIIVERLGKYQRTLGAGIHVMLPIIERARVVRQRGMGMSARIDLREQVFDFDRQTVITKDNVMENYIVHGVTKQDTVPSITDAFIGMFPFENEAHDLFGVNIEGIAIDFGGKFYDLAVPEPMTIISAEKQAAREKAAKVAAAKAAAEAKRAAAADVPAKKEKPSVEEQRAAFEAKIANLDPEKAAKMRAAFEAKLAKQAKEGE